MSCKYKCGSRYYKWEDKCGNSYRTLLVSATEKRILEKSVSTAAINLANLYNNQFLQPLTNDFIISLGLFDSSSTMVAFQGLKFTGPTVTLQGVADFQGSVTWQIYQVLGAIWAELFPLGGSTAVASSISQVLTNGLVSTTIILTITSNTDPTKKYIYSLQFTGKAVDCGKDSPVAVSGTITLQSPILV